MAIRNLLRSVVLIGVSTLASAQPSWSESLNAQDLIIIPEPTLSGYLFRDYQPDKEQMVAYYTDLFKDRTATEIIKFLEDNEYFLSFPSDSEVLFDLSKSLMVMNYKIRVEILFDEGTFKSVKVYGGGIK